MDLQSAVALSTLTGLTRNRAFAVFKELREQTGTPSLEEVIACAAPGANADRIAAEAREQASALLAAAKRERIDAIRADDESYPPLLRAIMDPPPVLWVRGQANVLIRPAVAIVGFRAASPYALEVPPIRGASTRAGRPSLSWVLEWIGFIPRSMTSWRQVSARTGLWSASTGPAYPRFRTIFRSGTVLSAGSRSALSSSKPTRRAGPSSPRDMRSSRAETSWPCRAASSAAATAAPMPS